MRLVFADIETGGLDPTKHPITQWAGVAVEAGREIEVLDLKIQAEDHELDLAARRLIGWPGAEKWRQAGAIPEPDAAKKISEFLAKHYGTQTSSGRTGKPYNVARMAGFNVQFDIDFTRAMFARNDLFFPVHPRGLDVLQLAEWKSVPMALQSLPADMTLEAVALWAGLVLPEGERLHSALTDARLALSAARKLYPQMFAERTKQRTLSDFGGVEPPPF